MILAQFGSGSRLMLSTFKKMFSKALEENKILKKILFSNNKNVMEPEEIFSQLGR